MVRTDGGFGFQASEGEELTLETVVAQALGYASVAWDPETGVFRDDMALDATRKVVAWVEANYDPKPPHRRHLTVHQKLDLLHDSFQKALHPEPGPIIRVHNLRVDGPDDKDVC